MLGDIVRRTPSVELGCGCESRGGSVGLVRVQRGDGRWVKRLGLAVLAMAVLATISIGVLAFLGMRGVQNPQVDELPDRADAVVVFSGEIRRTELALRLMEGGVSDVLVLSLGELDDSGSVLCGQDEPFMVLCPRPGEINTRGEARMFGQLAAENGWTSIIAVTGDYHAQRARLRLSRCYDGDVAFANVEWDNVEPQLVRRETLGYLEARLVQRGC